MRSMGASSALVRSAAQTSRPVSTRMIPGPNEIMVSDVSVIAPLLGQGGWGKGTCGLFWMLVVPGPRFADASS